jgi:hypothetical protein
MKRLLIPLMAASVAIGGAAPILASGEPPLNAAPDYLVITIDGKTNNVQLWATSREGAEWLIKNSELIKNSGSHSWTGAYSYGGPFSGGGAAGWIRARGKSILPPNSSIGAFRNASLDFATGVLFEDERSKKWKRNLKLVTKSDELRKDGTYVAVIEQTTLGYHY